MRWQNLIPKAWRLQYQLQKRTYKDRKNGILDLLATPTNQHLKLDYRIEITQPIKKSYLFENKIHNLQLGKNKIESIILSPHQIFSFWYILGHPNAKNGFKKGRNLINGKLKEDYGGGLCQLASILYHVALLGGLTILERHNHSLDIYEEADRFTPLGADATVVYGYKDLRFSNPYQIPLQFKFDITTEHITCKLYSSLPILQRKIVFKRQYNGSQIKVITLQNQHQQLTTSYYKKL